MTADIDKEKWHGWARPSNPDTWLCIGPLPGRKSIAMYIESKGGIKILTYFRSDDDARRATKAIDALLGFELQITF